MKPQVDGARSPSRKAFVPRRKMTRMRRYAPGGRAPSQEILDEVVARIREVVEPQKIILYGSAARGTMHRDSDLDLMVIAEPIEGETVSKTEVRIFGNLHSEEKDWLRFPFDLTMATPETIEEYGGSLGMIYEVALNEGKVLYEVNPERDRLRHEGHPHKWIEFARANLTDARFGEPGDLQFRNACLHAQQAIEKSMKAVLVSLGKRPPRTHDLQEIAQDLEGAGERITFSKGAFEPLSLFAEGGRHPDRAQEDDQEAWASFRKCAEDAVEWGARRVAEITGIPFALDEEPSGFADPKE